MSKGERKMTHLLAIVVLLLFVIAFLIGLAYMQLRNAGIGVKDFYTFINANESLDKLYDFAQKYEKLTPQEQGIYLAEAEKMFEAFDKIPETIWEDEHEKYSKVLDRYKDIKLTRWNEENEIKRQESES